MSLTDPPPRTAGRDEPREEVTGRILDRRHPAPADQARRGGDRATTELVLDAAALAPCLGLTAERYMALWRRGRIRYRVERGMDEDEGRFRVRLLYRGVRIALIVDAAGAVLADGFPEP